MLGQNIKSLRQARGMKQEELGRRLGVSKQSVSNWENENIMPSIEMLLRLSDCLCASVDFLLGRTQRRTLDITGLTDREAAHLQQLADDLRERERPPGGEAQ